tara:strand:- start:36 stop:794 length:759 start_codon:yes stop_codon:yes gene_type:complete
MPSPASRNAHIYVFPAGSATSRLFEADPRRMFREITCFESINPQLPSILHTVQVNAPMVGSISGPLANGARRLSWYEQYGDFGWDGRLTGKLINNDVNLDKFVTGTFTADKSGGTVAADTVTVTRAGVDVTASVTPPAFDGIITSGSGVITAILPTSTVGADLEIGDVLTFEVMKNGSSIGDATLTLDAHSMGFTAGMYEVKNVVRSEDGLWGGIASYANPTTTIEMKVGQTITGNFKSIAASNVGVIAYAY